MIRLIILLSLLCSTKLIAQNQIPEINNLQVSVDGNLLTIDYEVLDDEGDDVEILFMFSDNEGATFSINTDNATGDLGFPVSVGSGKSITWDFSGIVEMDGNYKVKLIADDRQVIDIQEIVNEVDSNRLRIDLAAIEGIRHRTAGAVHLQAVRDLLTDRFNNEGLETEIIQFDFNGFTGENIVGWKRGQSAELDTYIIDGHYDSVDDSPGADDNGSAVAGVLEALRVLAPYDFKKSIKFIGFDLEEVGLRGSLHHTNTEGIAANENVAGVFNLEMIGYYDDTPNSQTLPFGFELLYPEVQAELVADQFRGNFITNIGIESFPDLAEAFENAATSYVPELKVITILAPNNWSVLTPDLGRSDHAAFWLAGLPALMITDGSEFRYPYYHSPNDTLGNLDFTFMNNVVKATVAAVAELAELSHSSSAETDVEIITNTEQLLDCAVNIASNPNFQQVSIDFQACQVGIFEVELYDINGRSMYSNLLNTTNVDIPTDQLSVGTYILSIRQGNASLQRKIMIVR